ncbi:MAG TPA: hypothetical protein PLA88_04775 [Bacteroidales bacterium]|nr:hypothetical protein [Bacteroidales bacterium]
MKKIVSLIVLVFFAGAFSLMAQQVSYTVKTSAKCTNLTAAFSVPANKVANIKSLDVVPSFQSCSATNPNLTSIVVVIKSNAISTSGNSQRPTVYYKKTLENTGLVTESVSASKVKLLTGSYIMEVSASSGTEATLNLELFDN